jgi:hypothetical protein
VRVGGPLWEVGDGVTTRTVDPTTSLRAVVDRLMLMS